MKRDLTKKTTQDRHTVEVPHPSYQPSRAELREDLRINATFEELAKAVVQPVKVQYVKPQKKRG